jgi:hypothetical protein
MMNRQPQTTTAAAAMGMAMVMMSPPFRSIERRHMHKRPHVAKRILRVRPLSVASIARAIKRFTGRAAVVTRP